MPDAADNGHAWDGRWEIHGPPCQAHLPGTSGLPSCCTFSQPAARLRGAGSARLSIQYPDDDKGNRQRESILSVNLRRSAGFSWNTEPKQKPAPITANFAVPDGDVSVMVAASRPVLVDVAPVDEVTVWSRRHPPARLRCGPHNGSTSCSGVKVVFRHGSGSVLRLSVRRDKESRSGH